MLPKVKNVLAYFELSIEQRNFECMVDQLFQFIFMFLSNIQASLDDVEKNDISITHHTEQELSILRETEKIISKVDFMAICFMPYYYSILS